GRKVTADLVPMISSITRAKEDLRPGIQCLRIVRRNAERCYPVEPQQRLSLRPRRRNCFSDAQLLVEPSVAAELLSVVDPTAVSRVHLVVHAVAHSDRYPIREPDAARPAIARALPRLVILQTCIDVVRVFHINSQG